MNVIYYYYYYLFYKKILKDDTPHVLTRMAISACEAIFINAIIDVIAVTNYCHKIDPWIFYLTIACFLIINYFVYSKSGKGAKIIKEKPKFFDSNEISIALTLLFFIVTVSWMFWGSFYAKYILDNCI